MEIPRERSTHTIPDTQHKAMNVNRSKVGFDTNSLILYNSERELITMLLKRNVLIFTHRIIGHRTSDIGHFTERRLQIIVQLASTAFHFVGDCDVFYYATEYLGTLLKMSTHIYKHNLVSRLYFVSLSRSQYKVFTKCVSLTPCLVILLVAAGPRIVALLINACGNSVTCGEIHGLWDTARLTIYIPKRVVYSVSYLLFLYFTSIFTRRLRNKVLWYIFTTEGGHGKYMLPFSRGYINNHYISRSTYLIESTLYMLILAIAIS